MPALDSDEQHVLDNTDGGPRAKLKESGRKSITITWAAAVFVATCGWFYFIVLAVRFIAGWFSG
jgi:hypothetical protein